MTDSQPQQRFRDIQYNKIEIKAISHTTVKELIGSLNNKVFDNQFETKYANHMNERVFVFKVIYDGQGWEIRRTVGQFKQLEQDMANNIFYYIFQKKKITGSLETDDPKKTLVLLHKFLQMITCNEIIPQCALTFLEISCINLPFKMKEGFMEKKSGGRATTNCCESFETKLAKWQKRYFIITQQSLLYLKGPEKDKCQIRECLSFDSDFSFQYGKKETGDDNKIIIQFSQRKLILRAGSLTIFIDFIYSLFRSIKDSPYTKLHRFGSFSPIRTSECKWYIDGDKYFEDVCDAILKAKQTIYITDWWLSPEMYLKRPVDVRKYAQSSEFLYTRLDNVLKLAADKGVQVLVLLYNALLSFLYNDPKHAKMQLESMSPNIRVLKHPPQKIPKIFSHHEKMVVIDQKIGFMGGLDLCFGRWDTQKHPLFEVHPFEQLWPQIDFSNSRVRDFFDVRNYEATLLKENEPRMPWHDIAIQIQGDTVIDLSRHFVQYWNHVMMTKQKKKKQQLIHANDLKMEGFVPSNTSSFVDYSNVVYTGRKESLIQMKQPILLDEIKTQEVQIEMNQTIKQQEQIESQQQSNAQQFIQQQYKDFQNYQKHEKMFIPTQEDDEEDEDQNYYILQTQQQQIQNKQKSKMKIEKSELKNQGNTEGIQARINLEFFIPHIDINQNQQSCITQLTRSSCKWSTGIKQTEKSIQNAYLSLIEDAKHFIYIENQFFISNTAGYPVKNLVAQALISRIKDAHEKQQRFKVIVFLPLLPGFEGEIDQSNSAVLKVQLHFEYQTMSRGGKSIIEQLKQEGIKPENYIQFFGLRQHELSPQPNSIPVTEIIYIHSKLMIIDDQIALIGSANINDRSLQGNRDSELAIIVQDQVTVDTIMDGQPYVASKFAHTLRTSLYMEHFDMPYEKVIDPLNLQFEKESTAQANINTRMYKQVFACYPHDDIRKVSDYQEFKANKHLDEYDQFKSFIKGHAVIFPLQFLCEEDLNIKVTQKEYYVPENSFT
ncbi:unnamed protein product (macronuclear) [Paramecium tetraurelia]|uniref:Phospholipase n=1 Tax=Paramecium tetraurelia TaxID=5888 RepID=A0BVK5_PARTE|nr:uncharacterized protein GSPATT00005818001 [Paramecium tetraurelia]CAK62572.1 unnamed protein product [Paramecium tetraurelia]|eukprot:XP_001429970.1 hypothetical protein (macronuclear) [Paramecium tetraurelia strain d4-2]